MPLSGLSSMSGVKTTPGHLAVCEHALTHSLTDALNVFSLVCARRSNRIKSSIGSSNSLASAFKKWVHPDGKNKEADGSV